jgi:hypothetical protein
MPASATAAHLPVRVNPIRKWDGTLCVKECSKASFLAHAPTNLHNFEARRFRGCAQQTAAVPLSLSADLACTFEVGT